MIDYSVFMMGNPMDVDAAQKAYAKAQVSEIMPFSQFVKHIADHNGVFTRGTVKGVIADMCECLVEMLLEALQKLNERERQIFLARTLEEEDFETLGVKFELSYKGAAALYYRTIQKIRKSIEGGDKR